MAATSTLLRFVFALVGPLMPLTLSSQSATAESWQSITPEAAGFQSDVAEKLDAAVGEGKLDGLHSVLVVRNGKLVFERYYEGLDERWGRSLSLVRFDAETKHDLRSVSKSIVGLLYGIALQEGLAPALDAPIVDSFPEYKDLAADSDRRRMTVADALTMRLGTQWNESLPYDDPNNSEIAMEFSPDRYRFVLDRPFATKPGTQWQYNGGTTALLAKLIARGSGKPLFDFARDKLFDPLGISDVEWVKGIDGEAAAASGLRMRPRDLAKIGQVVLNRGQWNGKQLVPEDWLAESLTPRARVDDILEYGYQWWLGTSPVTGEPWMAAFGNGGQRLMIMPNFDLAIVITAGNYNQPGDWRLPVTVIVDYVLAALVRP
ncbi:serine hydrolase [Pelagibius sp. Alg239-R121]|uniref:serine hydrolase domain-containing protein n=1 Tax=Pelagibius sp. Alg239-R121 TaxID=2993448 RepID=UPI0024A6B3ED|nr:serine hydrolase [Pelagibius sp. Alg239-R121]